MKKEYILPLLVILIVTLLLFFRTTLFKHNPQLQKTPTPSQEIQIEPKLEGTTWEWMETKHADGTTTTPPDPSQFRLLLQGGTLTSSTDCNSLSGEYILDREVISFGPLTSTERYCEDSMESLYSASFPLIVSYHITDSYLEFILIKDLGVMRFAAVE